MNRPAPVLFMGGLKIVDKINSNPIMVHWKNHYIDENTYIKPKTQNGLVDKPYMALTPAHSIGERQ